MIREIKIGEEVRTHYLTTEFSADGVPTSTLPELSVFKTMALDTFNYQAGQSVLSLAGSNAGLSTMNAKSQAIIVKLMSPSKAKLDSLTPDEKDAWRIMETLASSGYGDSKKLVDGLNAVIAAVAKATDKSVRVMQATTHEEVIEILNEG